eukprot:CAMPEP_0194286302 /NCGR_PEP_ID=MMETSP0169-20130528/32255_1 /TAXON_ID=218684 /ORGANISM="Corethron pennatum, Strain L29A3" /LENGTH=662 /DNA_ID=CAMNT_0039032703 /DNA_START=334 /DNA_END=2322 /DNA_ORIENTATION=+
MITQKENRILTAEWGQGSCGGHSCRSVGENFKCGANSCNGDSQKSGNGGGHVLIGDNSCNSVNPCAYIAQVGTGNVTIGNNACGTLKTSTYEAACGEVGRHGGTVIIGNGACNNGHACLNVAKMQPDSKVIIGISSCSGVYGCKNVETAIIGNNACTGNYACGFPTGHLVVGNGSCQGERACERISKDGGESIVGNDSCVGEKACYIQSSAKSVTIGKNACRCPSCCECLEDGDKVPDNKCNSLGSGSNNCCSSSTQKNNAFDSSGQISDPLGPPPTAATSSPTSYPSLIPSSLPTTSPSSVSSSPPSTLMETLKAYTIILQDTSFDSTQFFLTTNHTTSDVSEENQVQMTIMTYGCNATYGGNGTGKSVMDDSPVVSIKDTTLVGSSLSTTFQVDRFVLENSKLTSGMNNSNKSTAGKLKFCLKAEIVIGSKSLNFRESDIELDYDLSSNSFSIAENQIEKESIVTSTESAKNIYSIQACRCGTTSYECLSDNEKSQSLNQDSVVNICVHPNSTDVKISQLSMSFLHAGLSQVKFETVTNSTGVPGQSIIRGTGIMADPLKITSRLISGLFDNGATQFKIEGIAYLQFHSSVRHLNLRADDRILQQEEADPGNVSYQMKVDITSRDMLESEGMFATFPAPVIVGFLVLVFSIAIVIYKKSS